MLKVKYGLFQPSLEKAFLERLRELREKDPFVPIAVVTPSRRMADRLQRLVSFASGTSALGVHFHTFHSLAVGILEAAGFPEKKLVGDPLFHDRLIDWILSHDKKLGARFGGGGRSRALASALRASIRDLVDAGVSPEDVHEHFEDGLLASTRLQDLLELESAYLGWLEKNGVLSPSGLTAAAVSAAEGSAFLARYEEILYYGFYDLTGLQLEFFEQVTSARPATLFFPYLQGHPAFRFCDDFFELKLHRDGPPESLPAELLQSPVRVVNASGARDELWRVAKEILHLVEEEGFDFDSIGVVARTLEPYRTHVAEVFGANAIPFAMAEGEPLVRYPLAKMCLTLLTLAQKDFPSHAVADLFHSPYFRIERLCDARKARELRAGASRQIERLHVAAGWSVWETKLRRAEIDLEDARNMLKVLEALHEGLISDETEKSWSEWSSRARKLIEQWFGLPKDASEAERTVWEMLGSVLDGLFAFDPLGFVTWDFFLDTIVEKIGSVALDPEQRLGVRVLNAMDARGDSFRVLFLIGLQDGLFPRQVREDPLLRDSVRARLKHPAGYWISQKASGHEEERLLFSLNVLAARERLYCVYSRSDEEGKVKAPSIYLRELCRAAGIDLLADAEHVRRQPTAKLSHCPPELLSPREVSVLSCLDGSTVPAQIRSLNEWGPAGTADGLIGPPKKYLAKLVRAGLSPTALERFSTCPFQFFASNVLKMGEAEEELEQGAIAPKLRGELYHAVLERFYRGLWESGYWKAEPRRDWVRPLDSEIEGVFSQFSWKDLGVYPLVWKAARRSMSRHLRRFVEWDMARIEETGLIPAFFEQELRGALPLPAIPSGVKGLQFRGRADRIDIDLAGGHYRVIDYKTSWRRYGAKRLPNLALTGRLHQLPVYGELARDMLGTFRNPIARNTGEDNVASGKPPTLEEACCYLLEDSLEETGRNRLQAYPDALWSKDRNEVLKGMSVILEGISEGWFPIRPEDDEYGHCRYCSFASICRKSHGPSRLRAEVEYEKSGLKRIHDRKRSS